MGIPRGGVITRTRKPKRAAVRILPERPTTGLIVAPQERGFQSARTKYESHKKPGREEPRVLYHRTCLFDGCSQKYTATSPFLRLCPNHRGAHDGGIAA